MRDPIRPIAPSTTFSSAAARPEQALGASAHPEAQHVEGGPPTAMVFAEFFSGDAPLTQKMRESGVRCLAPDDLATGGMDFASATQIRKSEIGSEILGPRTRALHCTSLLPAPRFHGPGTYHQRRSSVPANSPQASRNCRPNLQPSLRKPISLPRTLIPSRPGQPKR